MTAEAALHQREAYFRSGTLDMSSINLVRAMVTFKRSLDVHKTVPISLRTHVVEIQKVIHRINYNQGA